MLNYECKVESKSPVRRELTISVKPDSIQEYIELQLSSLQKTVKLKGFREGKVPLALIKQYYMRDVKSDVASKVIRDSYLRALEENKLTAVGMPEIQTKAGAELNEGESLTFTANVEIFPDIKVKELEKVKVTRPSSEVSDEDIEKGLANLRDSHADIVPDEANTGPVKTDDFVDISFTGTVDGEELDILKGDNRLVQVGARSFMEQFEDALIGMRKGETKIFPVDFPADFNEKKLAGRTVQFTVTVHEFKKKQLPEFDDEFAKRFKMETSLELRKKVVETLKEDRERESRDVLKENVLRALCDVHPFEIPSSMVQSQLEHLARQSADTLKRQGFTEKMIRDYLDKNKEQLVKRAADQVRVSLLLDRIAEEQGIRVSEADLEREYGKIAERLGIQPDQVRQLYGKDEGAVRQLRFRLKEEKALEYVLGQIKVSEAKS